MPRLAPLPAETTPELQPQFDFFLGTLGFTPNSLGGCHFAVTGGGCIFHAFLLKEIHGPSSPSWPACVRRKQI